MKLSEVYNDLSELYTLKYIIRYNNLPRITKESVAEHSFFVSLIVLRLYKYYKFNLEKALSIAITHDIAEVYISDVPRNIKNKFKVLEKYLNEIESKVLKEKFPEYQSLVEEFNEEKTVESLIVSVADLLSVVQYASTEVKLGSKYYMPEVIKSSKIKINKTLKKLSRYKR